MKKRRVRLYEGMYILNATLSEDARKKALEKIKNGITEREGKILKIHEWGKRRLAYTIDGKKEGFYYVIYFEIDTATVAELWKDYHLHEDLLRYMTLEAEEVLESLEFASQNEGE
ncbi:MAG: 30S ribosomal protein S6 [Parachlamydiales bacterium]|jgi:small subunit ribosomal protein S6